MSTNLTNVTYVTCCAMYLYRSCRFEIGMSLFQYALMFVSGGKCSVLREYIYTVKILKIRTPEKLLCLRAV